MEIPLKTSQKSARTHWAFGHRVRKILKRGEDKTEFLVEWDNQKTSLATRFMLEMKEPKLLEAFYKNHPAEE